MNVFERASQIYANAMARYFEAVPEAKPYAFKPWDGTVPFVTIPILTSDHSKIRGHTTMFWVDEAGDLQKQEIDWSKEGE